jgi:hypothetical protein
MAEERVPQPLGRKRSGRGRRVGAAGAAVLLPLLAACAARPQPAAEPAAAWRAEPGPAYEAALQALIDCGLRQIARLDDGRSDAGLVARAAASRCGREKAGFEAAAVDRALNPRAVQAVPAAVDDATQDTFSTLVLEVRAVRRERRGRGSPSAVPRLGQSEIAL